LVFCLYWTGKLRHHFSKGHCDTNASNDATWFDPYIRYLRSLVGVELGSFCVIFLGVVIQVASILGLMNLGWINDELDCVG